MAPASKPTRWRSTRTALRWVRRVGLGLLLLGVLAALYLDRIGVPGPVRALVVGALLDRGITVEFARLRMHWYRGLVAEGLKGHRTGLQEVPQVEFAELTLNLHWPALLRGRFDLQNLDFRNGRIRIPLQLTNEPPESLDVEIPDARLRIAAGDTWILEELTARVGGVTLGAHGMITNGSALPRVVKGLLRPGTPRAGPATVWRTHLRTVHRQLQELRFASPPAIRLQFTGDGRDLATFRNELRASASGAWTPWGELRELVLTARAGPNANDPLHQRLQLTLNVAGGVTRWASLRNARLRATILQPLATTLPERIEWGLQASELGGKLLNVRQARFNGTTVRTNPASLGCQTDFDFALAGLQSDQAACEALRLRGQARHGLERARPDLLEAELGVTNVTSGTRRLAEARLQVHLQPDSSQNIPAGLDPTLDMASLLKSWKAGVVLESRGLTDSKLELEAASLKAGWAFPQLTLDDASVSLYGGDLRLPRATLDLVTGKLDASLQVDFDVQRLIALPPGALRWLAQFRYATPPHAEATVQVTLPPWSNPALVAGRDLLPSLELSARVDGRDVTFNGLHAERAGVTILISNQVLQLRDLAFSRPEGRAELTYDLDLLRRDFRWRVVSCQVDAQAAAPAIDPVLPGIVGGFEFSSPPVVRGEVWGNWAPPKQVNLSLDLAATNFTFRGEAFEALEGTLFKHDDQLVATNVSIRHASGEAHVPQVTYSLPQRTVFLDAARSHLDPMVVARCIGTNVAALLKPYRFATPPQVEVRGQVVTDRSPEGSDLTFAVEGGPFQFWRFQTRRVSAVTRWTVDRVSITNVACEYYGGRLSGEFIFDTPSGAEPRFRFQARGTEFELRDLLHDVLESTNQISGKVTGTLVVTNALLADWSSWHGYGQVRMRDGMLWNLPIFGVFSKVMNAVVPGTGNSRATAAQGTYTISRSVIRTDNLEIAAGPAQLHYQGTVDFHGNVDARVMAEVLHRTPLIGPVISLVLSPAAKALEFKVSGTLADPVLKPLYVPGFLLPFLNPIGTMQQLMGPKDGDPAKEGK